MGIPILSKEDQAIEDGLKAEMADLIARIKEFYNRTHPDNVEDGGTAIEPLLGFAKYIDKKAEIDQAVAASEALDA